MELKVGANSIPNAVAGAIAGEFRKSPSVDIIAVGAGAINQAVKAIAICRGYLATDGYDVTCIPSFADVQVDHVEMTGIRFRVIAR